MQRKTDGNSTKYLDILFLIFNAFVQKIETVASWNIPRVLERTGHNETPSSQQESSGDTATATGKMDTSEDNPDSNALDKDASQRTSQLPIVTSHVNDWNVDSTRDLRVLLRSLLQNLSTIMFGIHKHSQPPPAASPIAQVNQQGPTSTVSPRAVSAGELQLLSRLFRAGIGCFDLWKITPDAKIQKFVWD